MSESKHSIEEKLNEVKRELAMRRKVYPRWIATGRLSVEKASFYLEILREIERDYEEQLK